MASQLGRTPLSASTENTYAFIRPVIKQKEQDRIELNRHWKEDCCRTDSQTLDCVNARKYKLHSRQRPQ
jgi:hypothetical protein